MDIILVLRQMEFKKRLLGRLQAATMRGRLVNNLTRFVSGSGVYIIALLINPPAAL